MLPLMFVTGAFRDYKAHPRSVLKAAGQELMAVQCGLEPTDWKPMPAIGPGVKEIRIWVDGGTFRIFYVVKSQNGLFVLHSFVKKTQATRSGKLNLRERD